MPGTLSGDGQPRDAYLLGWDMAVREAEGVVTAVLLRADDVEDKLTVVRPGTHWSDAEMMKAIWFQEQYFRSHLVR